MSSPSDERGPAEARRTGPVERFGRWCRRNWAVAGLTAAVLVLMAVGTTVSTWQAVAATQARADLAAKNAALAEEQAKVEAQNKELADVQAKVQANFELAQKAVALFHTGVSEDMLLKNAELKELRTKLLKEAAGFYADLEKLLAGQSDGKSRQALAAAYFQLGKLTDRIGPKPEALAVHRKALALRRELAAAPGADVEARLDVARSLGQVGLVLTATGDPAAALAAFQELRDLAERLEAEHPSDAVRSVLALGYNGIGTVQYWLGSPAEALQAHQKALAIRLKLADANPAVAVNQSDLATSYHNIGGLLLQTGKLAEALQAHQKALAIFQKLADASPAVTEHQFGLATAHEEIGGLLSQTGRPEEAIASYHKASAILQRLADANPAVLEYQRELARALNNLGRLLAHQKRFAEALRAIDTGLAIRQKLADADPKNAAYATQLGLSHASRGWALVRFGQPSRAADELRQAVALWAKEPAQGPDTRFERSRALALLAGLAADGKSGVTAAEAATFADQAVAALREAVKIGWALPSELKEPDFDALRGRDDFMKLVAEVEKQTTKNTKNTKENGQ
jgi:tetratricopeptide (TPR) repeat protein